MVQETRLGKDEEMKTLGMNVMEIPCVKSDERIQFRENGRYGSV